MTRQYAKIDPEVFCVAWQESETVQEAARRATAEAGQTVTVPQVRARAAYLRDKGVNLKRFPRGVRADVLNENIAGVNVERLNRVAAEAAA